jgi:hypothetical protein
VFARLVNPASLGARGGIASPRLHNTSQISGAQEAVCRHSRPAGWVFKGLPPGLDPARHGLCQCQRQCQRLVVRTHTSWGVTRHHCSGSLLCCPSKRPEPTTSFPCVCANLKKPFPFHRPVGYFGLAIPKRLLSQPPAVPRRCLTADIPQPQPRNLTTSQPLLFPSPCGRDSVVRP